jgi:hypothetical protein
MCTCFFEIKSNVSLVFIVDCFKVIDILFLTRKNLIEKKQSTNMSSDERNAIEGTYLGVFPFQELNKKTNENQIQIYCEKQAKLQTIKGSIARINNKKTEKNT